MPPTPAPPSPPRALIRGFERSRLAAAAVAAAYELAVPIPRRRVAAARPTAGGRGPAAVPATPWSPPTGGACA